MQRARPACLAYTLRAGDRIDTWDALKMLDGDGDGGVELLYSGYSVPAGQRDREYAAGWTREHVWPRSHGGFDVRAPGPGTDLHNLFAADASVNSMRNERDFDDGGEAVVDATPAPGRSGRLECRAAAGTWEPPDAAKGRVARAAMYMAWMYRDELGLRLVERRTAPGERALGRLSTLRGWARRHPPDAKERRRNDLVESLQGNRNPFVDAPGLADTLEFE